MKIRPLILVSASSCRAPDFSAGAPTGSSSKTGLYPGTRNSRCHLSPQLFSLTPALKISQRQIGGNLLVFDKKDAGKDRWSRCSYLRLWENKTSFFALWRSDAAANVRRQGCKSLTNAHCLVRQHLKPAPHVFWCHSFYKTSVFFFFVFQIRARDGCFFTLKCFDDSVHHFKVSPKDDPEATRKVRFDFSFSVTLLKFCA